jgi:hypothetical protein
MGNHEISLGIIGNIMEYGDEKWHLNQSLGQSYMGTN